jgi:hypothetical protein
MQKKLLFSLFFCLLCAIHLSAQARSFNDIFPNLGADIRSSAFSGSGYVRSGGKSIGLELIGGRVSSGIDPQIINGVMSKNPGYIVESILVIPVLAGSVTLLDVYNALGNIRGLSGRLYNSQTRNQAIPLFEDATRIRSERQTTAIPDPPPSSTLPRTETVFIRLKDSNFGNSYYRGDMSLTQNGLCYSLSNFRNLTYLLIPVIREDKFTAQLYFELLNEGVLIYSIAGADVSDFVASRVDMGSAIAKRLEVITSWAADGISGRR